MKTQHMFLSVFCILFGCQVTQKEAVPEDPDWIRLEIPGGGVSNSVTGTIDGTLLMTGFTRPFFSTDGGRTWQASREFHTANMSLLTRNDTTFLFRGTSTANNQEFAAMAHYVSTDYGKNWQHNQDYYGTFHNLRKQRGFVKASDGTTYSVKWNRTPVPSNPSSYYTNPSELVKTGSSGRQSIRFPFKHEITDLHLDSQNRLYVTVSGHVKPGSDNIRGSAINATAIIYVSRKPLP
ncbi:MAG: glycoside hydrolase [Cytophagales bacterium]|nr:glycoside hydrolase [Cytophagales bacterium]